jgi:hypothetical protein
MGVETKWAMDYKDVALTTGTWPEMESNMAAKHAHFALNKNSKWRLLI